MMARFVAVIMLALSIVLVFSALDINADIPDGVVFTDVQKIVIKGKDANLKCQFHGKPLAVYWKKGYDPESAPNLITWVEGLSQAGSCVEDGACEMADDFSLILKGVEMEDQGRYICRVANHLGNLISNFTDVEIIVHRMVKPMDVCVSGDTFTCKARPPKFEVPKPCFCGENLFSTAPCHACGTPIIVGCSINIICLVIVLLFCIFNKTRSERPRWIFINLCFAHLGLFSFFLAEAETDGVIAISFFFDYFLFVSIGSVLVEAAAILIEILHKTIPHATVVSGVCCWGLPAVKSILTVAINRFVYSSKCGDHFLKPGRPLHTTAVVLLSLIFLAIVILLAWSGCLLCRAPVNSEDKKAERRKVWYRIAHITAIFVCFFAWVVTLLIVGICLTSFGIVFIIFGSANAIVLLVGLFLFIMPGSAPRVCAAVVNILLMEVNRVSLLMDHQALAH